MIINTKKNAIAKIYHSTQSKNHLPVKIMYKLSKICGYEISTETGSDITISGDYNNGLKKIMINGKTEQKVTNASKNLLDVNNLVWSKGYYNSASPVDTGVMLQLASARSYAFKAAPIPLSLLGKTITLSYNCHFGETWPLNNGKIFTYIRVGYMKNSTFMSFLNGRSFEGNNIFSVTLPNALPSDASENILYLMANASTEVYTVRQTLTLTNIMIREGDLTSESQTVYEPFVPDSPSPDYPSPFLEFENETISFGEEVLSIIPSKLSSINDICDYIEIKNERIFKHQLIGQSTKTIVDALPNSSYLGTMTKNGISGNDGTIQIKTDEEIRYILKTPIVTDLTETELGQKLLEISTEYGKDKTLTISNGSLTVTQYIQS